MVLALWYLLGSLFALELLAIGCSLWLVGRRDDNDVPVGAVTEVFEHDGRWVSPAQLSSSAKHKGADAVAARARRYSMMRLRGCNEHVLFPATEPLERRQLRGRALLKEGGQRLLFSADVGHDGDSQLSPEQGRCEICG